MADTLVMSSKQIIPTFNKCEDRSFLSDDDYLPEDIKIEVDNINPSAWITEVVTKAANLLSLRKSWDSYNACVIKENAIDSMIRVLYSFNQKSTPMPSLVPLSNGEVQIEWHVKNRNLELEINENGISNLFYYDSSDEIELLNPSDDQIATYIEKIS